MLIYSNYEIKSVNENAFCLVFSDGMWSAWSAYSVCSCQSQNATGTQSKSRTCDTPTAVNGGASCTSMPTNSEDNSTGTQRETQTDTCPCPVGK